MSIAEKLQTIAENEQKVFEAGKQAAYHWFWDIYQTDQYSRVGLRDHYNNAFSNYAWNDNTYNPKYAFVPISYANQMFTASSITDTKQPIDFSGLRAQAQGVFSSCRKLKIIRTLTVAESTTYKDWFTYCVELENISIDGIIGQDIDFKDSTMLLKDSIENIIGHLSTAATGKTLILSKTAVYTAFNMSEDTPSEEWNELKASKSNWEIELA